MNAEHPRHPRPRSGLRAGALRTFGCACLLLATALPAQYRQMQGQLENAWKLGETQLNLAKNREEKKVLETIQQLREACTTAANGLRGFGGKLARVASEDRLKEPDKYGFELIVDLTDRVGGLCDKIKAQIDTPVASRGSDYQQTLENLCTQLFVKTAGDRNLFKDLTEKTDTAMRYMTEQLKYWITMRDDSGKAAETINNAKKAQEAKEGELEADSDRVFNAFRDASRKAQDARRRYADATTVFERARAAPASSSYTSDYKSAFEKWRQAEVEQKEAEKNLYDMVAQLQRFSVEVQNRLGELGRAMSDLDRFQAGLNPEALARRITEFTEWIDLLQKDIER